MFPIQTNTFIHDFTQTLMYMKTYFILLTWLSLALTTPYSFKKKTENAYLVKSYPNQNGPGFYYHIIHDNRSAWFFYSQYRNSYNDAARELADLCKSKNWTQYTQRTYGPYSDRSNAESAKEDAKRQWRNSGYNVGNDQG